MIIFDNVIYDKIEIEGFKVFKNKVSFNFNKDVTTFEADNGQGKTSIAESIMWVFLGMNLQGNDKADSKLVNDRGAKVTKVTLYFRTNQGSQVIERRKTQSSTTINLNGEKVKQEDITPMLGSRKELLLMSLNLSYFLNLPQKEQRDFVVSLLPELSPSDVLKELTEFENKYLTEELEEINSEPNKFLKVKRSEIQELETEKVRLQGQYESTLEQTRVEIPEEKEFNKERLNTLEKEYEELSNETLDITKITQQLQTLLNQKTEIQKKIAVLHSKSVKDQLKDDRELLKRKLEIQNQINKLEHQKYENTSIKKIAELNAEVEGLKIQYKKTRQIQVVEGDSCPTCRTEIRKEHLVNLKNVIVDELKEIQKDAEGIKKQISDIEQLEKKKEIKFDEKLQETINNLRETLKKIDEQIILSEKENIEITQQFEQKKKAKNQELKNQIDFIDSEMRQLESDKKKLENEFKASIGVKKQSVKNLLEAERKVEQAINVFNAQCRTKVEMLDKSKKELQAIEAKIKETEQIINKTKFTIDSVKKFNQKKADMLSELIKNHFSRVSINLQKINTNTGEIKDCFEINFKAEDGNERSTNLSYAESLKVGIEMYDFIVKTSGFKFPLYIDNSESITSYDTLASQVIKNRVVEGKKLVIEKEKVNKSIQEIDGNQLKINIA